MVDIAVLQEVKITDPKFAARKWAGYKILTAAAGTANCGGVALLMKGKDRSDCLRGIRGGRN